MSARIEARIESIIPWSPHLATLRLDHVSPPFRAGQFFNLALQMDGSSVRRSYSASSAPGQPLEFFVSEVQGGRLTPQLFALREGQSVELDPAPLGFFTLDEVPACKDLWLVATGTGLGPYISMLREGSLFERFERIVLVHGIRNPSHAAYRAELLELQRVRANLSYVVALSAPEAAILDSPPLDPAVPGRITTAWDVGGLEKAVGFEFNGDSHMLLCGNPGMIESMTERLKARGFEKHRRRKPGHFNYEKYW